MHLKGRGDWMTVFLLEVPPGGQSAPQQHLFDELFYVLSGSGSTVIELPDGGRHAFEWGPRSMFAPPLNSRYRIFNASGTEPVRLASSNNMRILMNVLHRADFLFDHPFGFPEREGPAGLLQRRGRDDRDPPRPQSVGDQFRSRSRRLRAQALGGARRRAPPTSSS